VEETPNEPKAPLAEKRPARRRSLRFLLILAAGVFLLVFGAVLLGRWAAGGNAKDAKEALARLKDIQREWWDKEGLATGPSKDPAESLERLQQQQRDWWESQGLSRGTDRDGTTSLARLEEQQRAWFDQEELATAASKDPAAALDRLNQLNQSWWNDEGVARAGATTPVSIEKGDPEEMTSTEEAKLEVKLLEKEGTKRFLDSGGTEQSEKAVQRGLLYLASQQAPDGHWDSADKVNKTAKGKPTPGKAKDVTITAFALLPFLARGETHKGSEAQHIYTKHVDAGVKFLLAHQGADGDLRGGSNMYTHALATMALCEDFTMTADPTLREPCQKAINFLIAAQARDGGWRYAIKPPAGDMSVSSWCLMALKSGQMAGLQIPHDTLAKATDFLKKVSRSDGGYNYIPGQPGHSPPTPAVMTAAGMVCRQYLQSSSGHAGGTEDVRSASMTRGVDIIVSHPPENKNHNFYYYYYATYALLAVGSDAWASWNPKARDMLVGWQKPDGGWDTNGAHQLQQAGRVGVTALALLTLEVYYRHLPLNRPELGEMAKDLKTTK